MHRIGGEPRTRCGGPPTQGVPLGLGGGGSGRGTGRSLGPPPLLSRCQERSLRWAPPSLTDPCWGSWDQGSHDWRFWGSHGGGQRVSVCSGLTGARRSGSNLSSDPRGCNLTPERGCALEQLSQLETLKARGCAAVALVLICAGGDGHIIASEPT